MENASKALLIAGAILIAILLIAIGMMVFNSANGVIESSTTNMSQQQKTAFNKPFTIYEGKQSGFTIKELVNLVNTNNSEPDNHTITITSTATNVTIAKPSGKTDYVVSGTGFSVQQQYNVSIEYENGVVHKITVSN